MPNKSRIYIHKLELNLNLGWRSKERSEEQAVFMDMEISFPDAPTATQTDNLDDTVCYAKIISAIQDKISTKSYKLIEHLSADIYSLVKTQVPASVGILVRITKYPRIAGLKDGVSFEFGDLG